MKKRIATAALWVYVGWYAGNLLSEFIGTSPLVGVIPAIVLAALFVRGNLEHTRARAVADRATNTVGMIGT